MINKELERISKDDLQALIDNKVLEYKTIEYKKEQPGNSDSDKKEFLADVTSFANASGGDLIYGIEQEAENGFPKTLLGLNVRNIDEEKSRLDNLIRTGIQPRLPSVNLKEVLLENSKYAIVIRVPKSWVSPHRVTLSGHDKFYSRNSSGKYPLDVGELRNAFNLSETVTERIRDFRTDRIAKILANETPVPLNDNPKIVLHLIPITSFSLTQNYEIRKIASNPAIMPPIYSAGWNNRYNLDGYLTNFDGKEGKSYSYTQFFRSGILEAVDSTLLEPPGEEHRIPSLSFDTELIESLTTYLSLYKLLNIEPPVFIFLTLLGVKGYYLAVNNRFIRSTDRNRIDRDILQLSENTIENYDVSATQLFKPIFDTLWNACGFPRDLNYNEEGKWSPPR